MSHQAMSKLFATRRFVYFIPSDGYVEGRGWRPSVVFEGEDGHYPNGNWPYDGSPGQTVPWFWGHDFNKAVLLAEETNERLGISKALAVEIISSSMAVNKEVRGRRK